MAFDNLNRYHDATSAVSKNLYDSEGQQIIGALLDSIVYSLASIADVLEEFNEKDDDDRIKEMKNDNS